MVLRPALLVLILAALLLGPPSATALERVQLNGRSVPRLSFDLAAPEAEGVLLTGEYQRHEMTILAPPRETLERVTLTLPLEVAGAVAPDSRLDVLLNGDRIGRARLGEFEQRGRLRLELDPAAFHEGANTLSLAIHQRHRRGCDLTSTYDLWTEIDIARGQLAYDLAAIPEKPGTELTTALLAASPGSTPLTILRPPGIKTRDFLGPAGLLSQAYGLHLRDRTPLIRVDTPGHEGASRPEGTHRAIIGTREELKGTVDPRLIKGINGPHYERFLDPRTGLLTLVFSGRTREDVMDALDSFLPTDREPLIPVIREPGEVAFERLGHDMNPGYARVKETTLRFRLPAGYHRSSRRAGGPILHLSLGLSAHTPVKPEVLVNGEWVASRRIRKPRGGILEDIPLELPWDALAPGINTITVRFVMPDDASGECPDNPFERDSRLMVFGDSTVEFTEFQVLETRPAISQAVLGYPGKRSGVMDLVALGGSDEAAAASLTIAADLARYRGSVLPVRGHTRLPGRHSESVVAAGPADEIPEHAFKQSRLSRRYMKRAFNRTATSAIDAALVSQGGQEPGGDYRREWEERVGLREKGVLDRLLSYAEDLQAKSVAFGQILPLGLERRWNRLPEATKQRAVLFEIPGEQSDPASILLFSSRRPERLSMDAHHLLSVDRTRFRGGGLLLSERGEGQAFQPSLLRYEWAGGLSWKNLHIIGAWAEQNVLSFILVVLGLILGLAASLYALLRKGRRDIG